MLGALVYTPQKYSPGQPDHAHSESPLGPDALMHKIDFFKKSSKAL